MNKYNNFLTTHNLISNRKSISTVPYFNVEYTYYLQDDKDKENEDEMTFTDFASNNKKKSNSIEELLTKMSSFVSFNYISEFKSKSDQKKAKLIEILFNLIKTQSLYKQKSLLYENSSIINIDDCYLKERYGNRTFIEREKQCIEYSTNFKFKKETFIDFYLKEKDVIQKYKEITFNTTHSYFNKLFFDFDVSSSNSNKDNKLAIVSEPDLYSLLHTNVNQFSQVNFYTFDFFSLCKNIIFYQMLVSNVESNTILQLWFSSLITTEANETLNKICEYLLDSNYNNILIDEDIITIVSNNYELLNTNERLTLKLDIIKKIKREIEEIRKMMSTEGNSSTFWLDSQSFENTLIFHDKSNRNCYFDYILSGNIVHLTSSNTSNLVENKLMKRQFDMFSSNKLNIQSSNVYNLINPFFKLKGNQGLLIENYFNELISLRLSSLKNAIFCQKLNIAFHLCLSEDNILNKIQNSNVVFAGNLIDISNIKEINNQSIEILYLTSNTWHNTVFGTFLYDICPEKRQALINEITDYLKKIENNFKISTLAYSYLDSNFLIQSYLNFDHKSSWVLSNSLKKTYFEKLFKLFEGQFKNDKETLLMPMYNPFSYNISQLSIKLVSK